MSQEVLERYCRAMDAWNGGVLDEWLEYVMPGWQHVTAGAFPGLKPVYRGREGALALWDAFKFGPWDDRGYRVEIERIEDLGEVVLALLTVRARGRESGVEVTHRWAHVITEKSGDDQIRSYASWEEGLEAVGLRE